MVGVLLEDRQQGVIAVSIVALCSCVCSTSLAVYLVIRLVRDQKKSPFDKLLARDNDSLLKTQYTALFAALLFVDFARAFSFVLTFAWVKAAPASDSATCYTQGVIMQSSYCASFLINVAIALHTAATVVLRRKLHKAWVGVLLMLAFGLAAVLSAIGPLLSQHRPRPLPFYGPVGYWCWIPLTYNEYRLTMYYAWLFASVGLCALLYVIVLVVIRIRNRRDMVSLPGQQRRRHAIASRMMLYPLTSILFLLPLVVPRLIGFGGVRLPGRIFWIGAVVLNCNGIVNVALYCHSERWLAVSFARLRLASGNRSDQPGLIACSPPPTPNTPRTFLRRASSTPTCVDLEKVAERVMLERQLV